MKINGTAGHKKSTGEEKQVASVGKGCGGENTHPQMEKIRLDSSSDCEYLFPSLEGGNFSESQNETLITKQSVRGIFKRFLLFFFQ